MNATLSAGLITQAPTYAVLQREMHNALRAQHPEWIAPDGDCPKCDEYDRRLAELLSLSLSFERNGEHA
jgi:hypothetical protein